MTPFSISWVGESDSCSLFTSLSVLNNWVFDFGWGCWESSLPPATSEPNFFIQMSLNKRNLRRRSRWRMYFLVHDFPSFHHNSFRDTRSWECVIKDDCVRSCLIELYSFLSSKFDVDPIHSVLMFLLLFWWCHARRGASRSILFGSLCSFFVGSTDMKNTVCLLLKFCPPDINPEFMMECKLIAHPMW